MFPVLNCIFLGVMTLSSDLLPENYGMYILSRTSLVQYRCCDKHVAEGDEEGDQLGVRKESIKQVIILEPTRRVLHQKHK
jgi:hypothetical protein